jgi:hypothetical protein
MGFFGRKRDGDFSSMSDADRIALIYRLESERDEIDVKIEKLMHDFKRRTGDRRAVKGAKRKGKSPKDFAYIEEKILKK